MDATSASRYRAAELALWRANGAEPVERWIEIRRYGINVRVLEVGEGPAVLFMHGALVPGSIWAGLVARIRGFRCLVLDRPGCGLSEPLTPEDVASPEALVDVEVAVLDALGVGRVHVVANSFGGACILWLATGLADRVDRIVLEGAPAIAGIRPVPFFRLLAAGAAGQFMARLPASRSALQLMYRQVGHRRLVATGWPQGPDLAWGKSAIDDTDTLRNDVVLGQRILTPRAFRRSRLFDPADLPRVGQPTLWLWGGDDPLATVERGRAWASTMPMAMFELFGGAGHLPWLDDPERHARRIERFLGDAAEEGSARTPEHAFA